MAQYDPLELAAYLCRARDPVSGFQPSFTDRDIHNQYDFDVRSPEEVALGAHIDPITGLPVGEEVKPSIESKIVSTTAEWKDLGEYKTTADLIQHELDLIKQQKNLVDSTIKEVEDARGVTLARKNLADYAALATDPTDPIYQQLENQLALRSKAAAIDFTLTDKGGLRGTKAQAFKVFDERFKQLEARKLLVAKDELLTDKLKQNEALQQQQRKLDKGFKAEDRVEEEARMSRSITATEFGWNSTVHDKVELFLGKKIDPYTAKSMSSQEAKLLRYASDGKLYNNLTELALKDTKLIDTYTEVSKKLKTIPEEVQRIENMAQKYKDALIPIDALSDRDLLAKVKDAEEKAKIERTAIDPKLYAASIDALRYKLKLNALNEAELKIKQANMTTGMMSLDTRLNIPILEKEAANTILELLKLNVGTDNLAILAKDPQAQEYIKQNLVQDYLATAGSNAPALPNVWEIMIAEAGNKMTEIGEPVGLRADFKSDPILLALRALLRPLTTTYIQNKANPYTRIPANDPSNFNNIYRDLFR